MGFHRFSPWLSLRKIEAWRCALRANECGAGGQNKLCGSGDWHMIPGTCIIINHQKDRMWYPLVNIQKTIEHGDL